MESRKYISLFVITWLSLCPGSLGYGVTYVRWGRSDCPQVGSTTLVYGGIAGGSFYTERGGGSNYVCLSLQPEWDRYNDDRYAWNAFMYGAEYQSNFPFTHTGRNIESMDVPCAVCLANRHAVLMIPGKKTCPHGWTKEYAGHLAANHPSYHRNEFACMDRDPVGSTGGSRDENGALFYAVEGRCGSLLCPPYVDGRELTCVVCTK